MREFLENTDRNLFLYLNGKHSAFFDAIMPLITEFWAWVPLFIWWGWLLYKKYPKKLLIIVLFIAGLILATDQGANGIKNTVKRYRPSHNPEIGAQVHVVNNHKGGQYGFVSNHAANVFGVAFFLFFLLRPAKKIVVASLFAWALFICYTRIYLGMHYPADLAGGATWGFICAYILSRFCLKLV